MNKEEQEYDFESRLKSLVNNFPKWVRIVLVIWVVVTITVILATAVQILYKPAKSYSTVMYNKIELAKPEAVDSMRSIITADSLKISELRDSITQLNDSIVNLHNNISSLDSLHNVSKDRYEKRIASMLLEQHDLESTVEWLNKELTKERNQR